MVYGASHRAGQLGESGPPRTFCYAAQSELIPAIRASKMTTAPNPPRSYTYYQYGYVWSCTGGTRVIGVRVPVSLRGSTSGS